MELINRGNSSTVDMLKNPSAQSSVSAISEDRESVPSPVFTTQQNPILQRWYLPSKDKESFTRTQNILRDDLWSARIYTLAAPFSDTVNFLDLPRWMAISLLCVYFLLSLVLFVYLVYSGTVSSTKVKYISLVSNSSEQICHYIPTAISGEWQANKLGMWSSNSKYNYNSSGVC
jgi:hypothetical protein